MRTDLSTNFETELSKSGRAPIQLLAFSFPESGTVRVSDRDLGPADGLSNSWSGLVEDWGTLEDIAATDPGDITIEARQMSITLINRGSNPFSDYFLKEDPEGVVAELYQWFDGLSESDMVLIDRFVVADPIQFSERGRLVTLDLVSAVVNMDSIVGGLLSSDDFPNAKEDDVGKPIDLAFGDCGRIPALCARTAPSATLNGSILSNSLTISVHEDLDALGFSASGTIQIGEELIRYGSRTSSSFAVVQRGYGSTETEHLDRAEVVELVTDHTFIIGRGPVQSIDSVQVGGYPAPAGIYSVNKDSDPARIVFSQKPYSYRFAAGSSFIELQFDATGADNTAYQAYKAYDAGDDATAARIDENKRVLSLIQATANVNRGEIVKAYLAVEHWESDTIVNDYAEVWIEGVGVVGRLSRPNPAEGTTIEADVDIDHGHTHVIGGEHSHNFTDPILQTSETPHTHTTSSNGTLTQYPAPSPYSGSITLSPGDTIIVRWTNAPTRFDSGIVHFVCMGGANLSMNGIAVADGTHNINIGSRDGDLAAFAIFKCTASSVVGATEKLWDIRLDVTTDSTINGAITGADTKVAVAGYNATTKSDKRANDVNELATDNAEVNITTSETTTRSHVNLFDITSEVAFDWSWFTDRDIKITYQGTADNKSIYILHCFFDVEYRARERFFSDDISAEVVGMIDDGSGTYTGTGSALITRPDHVLKRLLLGPGGFSSSHIDSTSYAATGARLAAVGYTVDGKIRGDSTVKEAIKKIAYQCRIRPFWSAGYSKLAFVESMDDWTDEQSIESADYQLNSISIERQPAKAVVNQIDLFYSRNWTNDDDGPAGFGHSSRATNPLSIAKFGIKNDPDRFLFDLVRSSSMAASLAAFYAVRFSSPSSYYTVNGYLPWFPYEKEDKILFSANFNRLKKARMRILGASRIFGSGKNTQINHVSLLLECLRYLLIEQSEADTVRALEALTVSLGKEGEFVEAIDLTDLLTLAFGLNFSETITVGEALSIIQDFIEDQSETITVAEALTQSVGIALADTVKILDDAEGWRQFGFGGGQFGAVGFGGWVVWYNRSPDEVAIFDELIADMIFDPFTEEVTIDDGLYLHSGFGCPIGSGFGLSPWGQ